MEIDYVHFFGFKERPFSLTPDERFFFESKSHKEAIDYLNFFLSQREGIALIYGDVGTGKTITLRRFAYSINKEKYNSAVIINPILNEEEFLREILKELQLEVEKKSFRDSYEELENFLIEEYKRGKTTVCLIDEAQLLPDNTLDFIRVLSNFETDKEKLIHIIFFAQHEFFDRIKKESLKYLAQRITISFGLRPLEKEEVFHYINYRLFKAGLTGTLRFREDAVEKISEFSKGNPRLINILCDRALFLLYSKSKYAVTANIVKEVLREESLRHLFSKREKRPFRWGYIYALFAALLLFFLFKMKAFDLFFLFEKILKLRNP